MVCDWVRWLLPYGQLMYYQTRVSACGLEEDIPFMAFVRKTWADLARYADSCELATMVAITSQLNLRRGLSLRGVPREAAGGDDDARRRVTGRMSPINV